MALLRCPICGDTFDSQQTTAMPFCSPRCRQIDLGRWLGERNALPTVRRGEEHDEADEAAVPRPEDDEE